MIQSPLIREIVEEFRRAGFVESILFVLQARFGAVGPFIPPGLAQVRQRE
jgi:hypothetical protein